MNEGRAKAEAEGDTVRIAGEVYLKTGLTVPAGVILDLTADKAKFELQNGAKLTVDGAVNASGHGDQGGGWVEGSLRLGEGTMLINGSGTISLKSKGRILNVGKKANLTLEGVALVGIADNDSSLVQVEGELLMKSGAITGNTRISVEQWGYDGGGGVFVSNKGQFVMEGGEISGNSVTGVRARGGGVILDNDGVFIMKAGKITGNSAIGSIGATGGGVNVGRPGSSGPKDSVFTMEGGEISGNNAAGKEWVNAGGVAVSGTFTMSGGIISGNTISGKEAKGGGVKVEGGIFTMQGGTIAGNSASGSGMSFGGGVYAERGPFILQGGTIYGKAATLPAGVDPSLANSFSGSASITSGAAVNANGNNKGKWGTGGTYTKGGVPQTGGSDITTTDETLIAIPAQ
jgi:hypothetical protein